MDPVAKRPVIGHRANALGRDGPAERDAASRENGQPSEPAETIWTRLAVDHIPLLTTIEAASYLGYRTPGAIRMAVYRHWLMPSGRGPRGRAVSEISRPAPDGVGSPRTESALPNPNTEGCTAGDCPPTRTDNKPMTLDALLRRLVRQARQEEPRGITHAPLSPIRKLR